MFVPLMHCWEIPLMLQLEYMGHVLESEYMSVFLNEERILKPHSSLCLVVYRIIFSIFTNVISCNSWGRKVSYLFGDLLKSIVGKSTWVKLSCKHSLMHLPLCS